MLRLGKWDGKIYTEEEVDTMNQCGVCITEEQSQDEDFIKNKHVNDLLECCQCFGCPKSQSK